MITFRLLAIPGALVSQRCRREWSMSRFLDDSYAPQLQSSTRQQIEQLNQRKGRKRHKIITTKAKKHCPSSQTTRNAKECGRKSRSNFKDVDALTDIATPHFLLLAFLLAFLTFSLHLEIVFQLNLTNNADHHWKRECDVLRRVWNGEVLQCEDGEHR